jgi:hypothetical protein
MSLDRQSSRAAATAADFCWRDISTPLVDDLQLTGVRPADAGIASGFISTSQQIGGAIGVAAATTIATTFTNHYVRSHVGTTAFSGAALTHGFSLAFYVLAATAAVGAVIAARLIESQPAQAKREPEAGEPQVAVCFPVHPTLP